MWATSYQATTMAEAERVWEALRRLHTGESLGPSSDSFVLDGPFAVGTELTITPQGQDPMRSTIVELTPNRAYADRTLFGELELTFRHSLRPVDGGGTIVTHTLEIDGPGSAEVGPELGPQISADFPVAMAELLAAAERGVA